MQIPAGKIFLVGICKKAVDRTEDGRYNINCCRHDNRCASGSAVEHNLAKVGVAGSIPVSRSISRYSFEYLLFLCVKQNRSIKQAPQTAVSVHICGARLGGIML